MAGLEDSAQIKDEIEFLKDFVDIEDCLSARVKFLIGGSSWGIMPLSMALTLLYISEVSSLCP